MDGIRDGIDQRLRGISSAVLHMMQGPQGRLPSGRRSQERDAEEIRRAKWKALGAILGLVGTAIGLVIAREALVSHPSVEAAFKDWNYPLEYSDPCVTNTGGIFWSMEYALGYDITNRGQLAVALRGVGTKEYAGVIKTGRDQVDLWVHLNFFGTREALDEWRRRNDAKDYFGSDPKNNLELSGPPINLEAGETKRIVLRADESMWIDPAMSPSELFALARDANWISNVVFDFSDGSSVTKQFHPFRPYQFFPERVALQPWEPCETNP